MIREAFRRLILCWENSAERKDMIGDIITLRCSFLVDRALRGLRIDFEQALNILRNHNDFTTERERRQRDILLAAVDNLVDFAAAEETALLEELPEEPRVEEIAAYESLCERYNLTYAARENGQVLFAASMAAWWLTISPESIVTYMTQGGRARAAVAPLARGPVIPQVRVPAGADTAHRMGLPLLSRRGRLRVGARGAPRR